MEGGKVLYGTLKYSSIDTFSNANEKPLRLKSRERERERKFHKKNIKTKTGRKERETK